MKKSICLIAPTLEMGGLQRSIINICEYFHSRGYLVSFILLYKFEHFYELPEDVLVIEPETSHIGKNKLLYHISLISFIRKAIMKLNPDRVLSFSDYHNPISIIALAGTKLPVYISDRASPDLNFGFFWKNMRKWTYKYATGIIAQTKKAAEQKMDMCGSKTNIVVIPNILRSLNTYNVEKKKYIIGSGRFFWVKGFDRLVKAFALIAESYPEWSLVLIGGGGPESENINALVDKIGLKNQVLFPGRLKDVDHLLSEGKIFVMPSRSEGYPNALCEAMAAGLACVSFDFSAGPAEIITNEFDGLLVEDGNIEAMAKKIKYLIEHEDVLESIAKNALLIKDRLSKNKIGAMFESFIFS